MTSKPFHLSITASVGKSYASFIRRYLRAGHRLIPDAPPELSLAIVSDATMARLHKQFLNLSGPTDVLTFELEQTPAGKLNAGEVIICLGEARRQSRQRGTPVSHELLLYALHGLLHLSGFDDRTQRNYKIMHRMEDSILTRIGIGPVFKGELPKT